MTQGAEGDERWWSRPVEDVERALDVRADAGITDEEAARRREQHGANALEKAEQRSGWAILLDQFKSVVLLVLIGAGAVAFATGHVVEGVAIVAVVVVNAAIGFVSEWRARRSMEALQALDEDTVRVRRGGDERTLPTTALVPGDVLLLDAGDLVGADVRIIESNRLRVDEAPLTGESEPVGKTAEPVEGASLAERRSMLFKGTTVVEGSGGGVVVATGMRTELGKISELAQTAESGAIPLEKRLDELGARLAWITLAIAVVVAGVGLLAGQPTRLMIETAIALGVAAIPEGLPIVATLALARGMWRMARRNALIRRLAAVETLGATSVILTDKTGTLTESNMTLRRVVTPGEGGEAEDHALGDDGGAAGEPRPLLRRALEIGALCSNAALDDDGVGGQGDPTEVGLLRGAARCGIERGALLDERPEEREASFDPRLMMMATFHRRDDGLEEVVKGAPDAILDACGRVARADGEGAEALDDAGRDAWRERAEALAGEGLRVLAVADRRVDSADVEPYEDLRFVGLVGLLDPPRADVADAIASCRSAGIRVVMVTGDQPHTARAIAAEIGIGDDAPTVVHGRDVGEASELTDERRRELLAADVFARMSPGQKLDLIALHQDAGATVAMTGDGVNDAPALEKADIGIAMGQRGTDAAREASDMVLRDDAFGSIVAGVRHGRVVFDNIVRSVMFMLCTNVAEVIAVAAASFAGIPVPLLPLQILYLNVLTDVLPALALGLGEGDDAIMDRAPRDPDEAVLTRGRWLEVAAWGVCIAAIVLTGLGLGLTALGMDALTATTVSFLTIGLAKLWFVFNLRQPGSSLWRSDVVRNPWMWGGIGVCVALLVAAVYLPGLSDALQTRDIGAAGWGLALGLSLVPFVIGQVALAVRGRKRA